MAKQTQVKVDPKQLEHAEYLWKNFVEMSKWGIVAAAVIMIGLAAAFVPFGA